MSFSSKQKKAIRYRRVSVVRGTTLFFYFYFEQYLFRGAQFSDAGLNGALIKRKKQHKKEQQIKKKNGTTKYSESIGGSIWLGSKVPF